MQVRRALGPVLQAIEMGQHGVDKRQEELAVPLRPGQLGERACRPSTAHSARLPKKKEKRTNSGSGGELCSEETIFDNAMSLCLIVAWCAGDDKRFLERRGTAQGVHASAAELPLARVGTVLQHDNRRLQGQVCDASSDSGIAAALPCKDNPDHALTETQALQSQPAAR